MSYKYLKSKRECRKTGTSKKTLPRQLLEHLGKFLGISFVLLVVLTLLVLGSFFMVDSVRDAYYGLCSRSWPIAEGSVMTAETTGSRAKDIYVTRPNIEYLYVVGGKEYVSRTWRFDGNYSFYNKQFVDDVTKHYSESGTLTVHYHPKNPKLSVLEPGFRKVVFAPMVVGLFLVLLGCLVVRYSRVKHGIATIPDFALHVWWRRGG